MIQLRLLFNGTSKYVSSVLYYSTIPIKYITLLLFQFSFSTFPCLSSLCLSLYSFMYWLTKKDLLPIQAGNELSTVKELPPSLVLAVNVTQISENEASVVCSETSLWKRLQRDTGRPPELRWPSCATSASHRPARLQRVAWTAKPATVMNASNFTIPGGLQRLNMSMADQPPTSDPRYRACFTASFMKHIPDRHLHLYHQTSFKWEVI